MSYQMTALYHCLDQPNEYFQLGQYQIIYQLCLAELLSLYYIDRRPLETTKNGCERVVFNDKISRVES